MDGSYSLFQRYWKVMLDESHNQHVLGGEKARLRYNRYVKIIQDAISEEKNKETVRDSKQQDEQDDGDGNKPISKKSPIEEL